MLKLFILLILTSIDLCCAPLKIYMNSVPKCGTHLLLRVISEMTGLRFRNLYQDLVTSDRLPEWNEEEFFLYHVRYSDPAKAVLEREGFKNFLIIRDPRDQVVSFAYFVKKHGHTVKRFFDYLEDDWLQLRTRPVEELISYLINGVGKHYGFYLPWLDADGCCVVKFEKLVGPKGGGSLKEQFEELEKIARYLSLSTDDMFLKSVSDNVYGDTFTFREGKIGSWKNHFSDEQKEAFKEVAGQLLIDLGYEKDLNW